ncbi:MAG: Ku protein [Candidatus Aenigmatarchaeota archaeon]|nr:MAG: Ku protein [Candidatus Aenigmarchaeota archaeon]
MPRAILKTNISFGLVNIPVKVYTATEERAIAFKLLCGKCKTPLKYKRWCEKCKREVPWEEVIRGYEIAKNKYIPISEEELATIKLETTHRIEIIKFVDLTDIDPIYMAKSYYLVPDKGAERAYSLFKEVLQLTGKVAIGRVVMRDKEHLVLIRPYKKGLVMTDLHYASEVRDINSLEELKKLVHLKEAEIKLAQALVAKLSGKSLKLEEFKDRYKEAVEKLVEEKAAGMEIKAEKPEKIKPTQDLLQALKASIEIKGKKKKK